LVYLTAISQQEEITMANVFEAKLLAAANKCQKREPVRRLNNIDARIANEAVRSIKLYPDGSLLTVQRDPMWEPYENEKHAKRGEVRGFTAKARKRFLTFVASLRVDVLPLFLTLTYPADWPHEWQHWKEHLSHFGVTLIRKWFGASAVWKLEPQDRGAPHFHLMVWGVPFMPAEWLAKVWYEIVGSGDPRHLKAGTSVERARSFKGVMCYAGKKYLGKEVQLPRGWGKVGRFWGVLGRKSLPRSRVVTWTVSRRHADRFRRIVRKRLRSKGVRWTGRNVQLYTQAHLQWARVVDWAESGSCQPIDWIAGRDLREVMMNQPF
jgi:hypothetical protein